MQNNENISLTSYPPLPPCVTKLSHQPEPLPILPCTDSIWQVWLARLHTKCGANFAHPIMKMTTLVAILESH